MSDDVGVTAADAAQQVGVKPKTIYKWVYAGALTPIPGTDPMQFWSADVFAAEASRKRSMRRPTRRATFAENDH
ncbi:hypothetical protein ACFQZ2_18620 [Streptomonospora algeriensis]|uniref:Helix-turn-helix domain-containing protein n=1 Tax=Streptomonospora algeriensis TaxID=995084 RepID=A0ABW3BCJ2_9ACTN